MSKSEIHRSGRTLTSYLVLTAGLLLTLGVSYHLNNVAKSQDESWALYTLAVGLFISFLFFVVTQIRARDRAERSATEVRVSDATMRSILAGRERAEDSL